MEVSVGTSDIMSEISAASQEQSAGLQQINQVMNDMDHMTQRNAALVNQAAAAASSLQEQAASLATSVSVFKLIDDLRATPTVSQAVAENAANDDAMVAVQHTQALTADMNRRSSRRDAALPPLHSSAKPQLKLC